MIRARVRAVSRTVVGIFVLAGWGLLFTCACGGNSTEREHTSTVVRGTYGDPNPIVPACEDAGSDATRDAC